MHLEISKIIQPQTYRAYTKSVVNYIVSVSIKLCAPHRLQRLRLRTNLLRTDILMLRHIVVQHKTTLVSQTRNFLNTDTARFWAKTFFFLGLHLISVTKIALVFEHKNLGEFPEKVSTRQNFCSQRAQKIKGNIVYSFIETDFIPAGHHNLSLKTISIYCKNQNHKT